MDNNKYYLDGVNYVKKGDNRSKRGFFWYIGFDTDHLNDSLELYEKAINRFKLCNCFKQAAETCVKKAKIHQLQSESECVASCYKQASHFYLRCSSFTEQKDCLIQASYWYVLSGKMEKAAELELELAKYYQKLKNYTEAVNHCKQSLDFCDQYSHKSSYLEISKLLAQLLAYNKQYHQAITILEQLLDNFSDDKLLRWTNSDLFWQLSLRLPLSTSSLSSTLSYISDLQDKFPHISLPSHLSYFLHLLQSSPSPSISSSLFITFKLDEWSLEMLSRLSSSLPSSLIEEPDLT